MLIFGERHLSSAIVASISDTFGPFDDQTSHGPFQLDVLNHADKAAMIGGDVLLRVDPKGDDTWRFNFIVVLHFDDATALTSSATGVELNESTEQQQTFGID